MPPVFCAFCVLLFRIIFEQIFHAAPERLGQIVYGDCGSHIDAAETLLIMLYNSDVHAGFGRKF